MRLPARILDMFAWIAALALCCALPGGALIAHGGLLASEGALARGDGIGRALSPGRSGRTWLGLLLIAIALLPVWALVRLAQDARLIDPEGRVSGPLSIAAAIAGALTARWVLGRAPSLRELLPLVRLDLALGALLGSALWLLLPTGVLAFARGTQPLAIALSLAAGALLTAVAIHLPFLQARFSANGKLEAFLELGEVREGFRRAPILHLIAVALLVIAALPAGLVVVADVPRSAHAPAALVVLPVLLASRLAAGLAYRRGQALERRAPLLLRAVVMALLLSLGLAYALITWMSPVFAFSGSVFVVSSPVFLLPLPL